MDDFKIVGHYENGIIKGLTKEETKEHESLEVEREKLGAKFNEMGFANFVKSPLYEESNKIKERIHELEDKMEGIPYVEYKKQPKG